MASCPRVLAIEGPFSRELLGETGYFFTPATMPTDLRSILRCHEQTRAMRDRVLARYRWDAVAESYVRLTKGQPAEYPKMLARAP